MGRDDGHVERGHHAGLQGRALEPEDQGGGTPEGRWGGGSAAPSAPHRVHGHPHGGQAGVAIQAALVGHEAGEDGGEDPEPGRHVAAHVVQGQAAPVVGPVLVQGRSAEEGVLQEDGRELHAWVDGRSHRAPQRIPGLVVVPLEEFLGPVQVQVLRRRVERRGRGGKGRGRGRDKEGKKWAERLDG